MLTRHLIKVDENIQPVIHVHPARKIPIALRDTVKDELDRMEREGVIVKQREPTRLVNAMVTVTKPNGKIRVCIDPRDRAILREHFPWKLLKKLQLRCLEPRFSAIRCYIWILADLTRCWKFAKLCTFNSPFGRHRFTQMSFEIKSAPEVFQRAISEMLQDLDGTEAIIDITVWGTRAAENDKRSNALLDRARQHNLKLSMDRRSERVDLRGTYLQIYWLASETRPW